MRGKVLFYRRLWAISSAGERFLHTEEVAGSKPASPTNKIKHLQKAFHLKLPHCATKCVSSLDSWSSV